MSNETFISMFPYLNTLASTIPIGTASIEQTCLRNRLGEVPLDEDSYRVTREAIHNSDLENVVDIMVQKK